MRLVRPNSETFKSRPRFSDQRHLDDQVGAAARAAEAARAKSFAAVRDQVGGDKTLLLAHVKHVP